MAETEEMVSIPKQQLEALLQKNEDLEKDIVLFRSCVMKFCGVLGIADKDGKNIKPEIKTGSESVIGSIMKSAGDILLLFGQTTMPGLKKRAEQKIKDKFSFFEEALPIIDKYGTTTK